MTAHIDTGAARRAVLPVAALVLGLASFAPAAFAQEEISITAERDGLTMINVMTPEPDDKKTVLELIGKGLREEMATVPGFQRAAVHSSQDDATVTIYAHWASPDALQDAIAKLRGGDAPNMTEAYRLGKPNAHPYVVEEIIVAE